MVYGVDMGQREFLGCVLCHLMAGGKIDDVAIILISVLLVGVK